MAQYRIAVIVGSLRKDSLNRKVARSLIALNDRLDGDFVEIGDLPLYNPELETDSPPEAWSRYRESIRNADAILFVSPEYNRSIPGALKNAIDVGSRPAGKNAFAGKPAAVVTVSPGAIGGFGANHHIRQCCATLNMPVLQNPEAYFGRVGDDSFDETGMIKDPDLKKLASRVAKAFADWVERLAPAAGS